MPLTPAELDEFLAQPHVAVVATASPAGAPHAMPIWYLWRDGRVLFHTGESSRKMRNLNKNNRISVVVDSKVAPYKVAVIEGIATSSGGDAPLAREIAIRYLGEKAGARYADASGDPGTLVTVTPLKIISWDYARESNP